MLLKIFFKWLRVQRKIKNAREKSKNPVTEYGTPATKRVKKKKSIGLEKLPWRGDMGSNLDGGDHILTVPIQGRRSVN